MVEWTEEDTRICDDAEASGIAINKKTGEPMTLDELDLMAKEYDIVRSTVDIDEFLKEKIESRPFGI